jgi:2-polyprenyl-3-methyl-5-hydroxy-6-metoxy-1,4-benzoquinol methylase
MAQMHSDNEVFNFDQCKQCEFVFLNPRVSEDQLKHYYTSYYLPYRGSEAWGKYKGIVQNNQKQLDLKRVNRVKSIVNIQPDSLILDVGCGHPSFLKKCHDVLKCKTLGLDFSDEGWHKQSELFNDIGLQVGEINDLPKDLNPDVITMWHYLEHDYTPFENLSYLRSIAQSKTKLIIEIPNFESSSRKKFGADWAGWHTPRHTSLFSPQNIRLLLEKSGWKVTELFTYGTMDPYLLEWMSRMEKKKIQWNKNMEDEFISFVVGMLRFLPKKLKEKKSSLGIMTVIADSGF